MSRPLRILGRILLGIVLVTAGAWIGCLASVWLAASRDEAKGVQPPVTAIVVLGAAQYDGRPSPVLRARLDHGIDLWQHGLGRRFIVTGGRAEGDWTSEAAVGRRYAVAHGVPDSVILLESEGRTTDQSLRASAALLHELVRHDSLHAVRPTAILVSDPFHMLRLGVVARRYDIVPYTSPTRTSPITARSKLWWRYMVGESLKVPFVVLTERNSDEGPGMP